MNRIIKLMMNLKLRSKLFLSYLFIIILVITVNYMIYGISEANTIKNIESSSTNMVEQLSNNISYKMSGLDTDIFYAVGASKIFDESNFSDYVILMQNVYVFNMYLQNSGIHVVNDFFMNASGSCFYYDKDGSSDYVNSNIYRYLIANKKSIIDASGKPIYVEFDNEPGVLYIIKSNITLNTHVSNGIMAIGIRDSYIKDLFSQSKLQNGSIVVCDGNSKILICDEKVKPIADRFNGLLAEDTYGQNFFNYKDKSLIVESGISENKRWKVLYLVSVKDLLKDVENIKRLVIILCITLLVFSIAIALVISNSLTSNIRLLLKKIKSVGQGNFKLHLEPKSHDETAELFKHFNIMSEKLEDLIERIAYEKTETQRAEYNALLAQINPHFIYNLLESINGLAKIKGQDEIVQIISALSYLIRSTICGKNSEISLKNELEYVKNYMSIEQIITGGRISIEYDIDDDTLDCIVPKFILQPLVENAINHGIEFQKSGGLILISAHKEDDVLKINISDDGTGIEEDKLQSIILGIQQPVESSDDAHTHIGIKSVDRRIKILYGNKYGLKISSKPEIGTVVEIIIPIKAL
ncbi:sensor histidine kinase [Clostridium oryzae]|uniref:histidine kinase n=1 Tax=Clostridium oryzae TaxID=1450648 RepID=A0A1V4ITV6_9CLOT|nr:histidine kinase [Clostridium oryzae]OPJ63452.1 sensor histidine kinase YpdA [Clostridium oryzae]